MDGLHDQIYRNLGLLSPGKFTPDNTDIIFTSHHNFLTHQKRYPVLQAWLVYKQTGDQEIKPIMKGDRSVKAKYALQNLLHVTGKLIDKKFGMAEKFDTHGQNMVRDFEGFEQGGILKTVVQELLPQKE